MIFSRFVRPLAPALAALALSASAAAAQGPGGTQAVLLGTFGDWGAYTTQTGKAKICYALSQPKERLPAGLNRDPGYLFVSFRPSENVRNEVAVVVGFPTRDGSEGQALVDETAFTLVTKGQNAWVKNPAEEGKLVEAFVRGRGLVLKISSARGNETRDRYSLSGFTAALDRAKKACES